MDVGTNLLFLPPILILLLPPAAGMSVENDQRRERGRRRWARNELSNLLCLIEARPKIPPPLLTPISHFSPQKNDKKRTKGEYRENGRESRIVGIPQTRKRRGGRTIN